MSAKLPKSKATNAYDLLEEVRQLILEEPKRYNQEVFRVVEPDEYDAPLGLPQCGTVGCVAGWVITLKAPDTRPGLTCAIAQDILGLNDDQVGTFFDGAALARKFPEHDYVQTKAYARAGAAHIRRFQKKYAAQLKAQKV